MFSVRKTEKAAGPKHILLVFSCKKTKQKQLNICRLKTDWWLLWSKAKHFSDIVGQVDMHSSGWKGARRVPVLLSLRYLVLMLVVSIVFIAWLKSVLPQSKAFKDEIIFIQINFCTTTFSTDSSWVTGVGRLLCWWHHWLRDLKHSTRSRTCSTFIFYNFNCIWNPACCEVIINEPWHVGSGPRMDVVLSSPPKWETAATSLLFEHVEHRRGNTHTSWSKRSLMISNTSPILVTDDKRQSWC